MRYSLLFLFLPLLGLVGAAGAGLSEKASAPRAKAPSSDESEIRTFTLVYNVNNSGYIDVCGCKHKEVRQGSLTRRSSFLKQLRGTGREIMLLDGGSSFFPVNDRLKDAERGEAIRKAELIVEAYNRMGYDAMAVGAFDLAAGLDVLQDLEKKAKFPLLSANLADGKTGRLYFPPHTVLKVGGVRVGVIGLTLSTMSRVYLDKVAPDAELLDPLEAARKSLEALREQTDVIVALSHLREETNFDLVDQLEGLQIVVDPFIQYLSHSTWIKEDAWVTPRGDSVILRSDGQGARLGVVDIELAEAGAPLRSRGRLRDLQWFMDRGEATEAEKKEYALLKSGKNFFRFTRVSLEPHHLTDPEIDRLVEEWKKNIDPAEVSRAAGELPRKDRYTTHDKCRACHEEQHAFWKKTAHARAYETLEKTGDQHRFDCVGCHAFGYGQAFLDTTKIGNYADVQCESCHGNNPEHLADPKAHAYGKVERLGCITCHNEEQTKKSFNFFRSRKIVACPKM